MNYYYTSPLNSVPEDMWSCHGCLNCTYSQDGDRFCESTQQWVNDYIIHGEHNIEGISKKLSCLKVLE